MATKEDSDPRADRSDGPQPVEGQVNVLTTGSTNGTPTTEVHTPSIRSVRPTNPNFRIASSTGATPLECRPAGLLRRSSPDAPTVKTTAGRDLRVPTNPERLPWAVAPPSTRPIRDPNEKAQQPTEKPIPPMDKVGPDDLIDLGSDPAFTDEGTRASDVFNLGHSPPASPFMAPGATRVRETWEVTANKSAAVPNVDVSRSLDLRKVGLVAEPLITPPSSLEATLPGHDRSPVVLDEAEVTAREAAIDDTTGQHLSILPPEPPERTTAPDGSPKNLSRATQALEAALLLHLPALVASSPPPPPPPSNGESQVMTYDTALAGSPEPEPPPLAERFERYEHTASITVPPPPLQQQRQWRWSVVFGALFLGSLACLGVFIGLTKLSRRATEPRPPVHSPVTAIRQPSQAPTAIEAAPIRSTLTGACIRYIDLERSGQTAVQSGYRVLCGDAENVMDNTPICQPVPGVENLTLCNALVQACGRATDAGITFDETCLANPPPPFPAR